ncbi:2'-5' RNA ligase family protein [Flavobacterium sp. J27]|uniref:2'-5' RNA ligase family protein n=1 Tax=Flavobacterium sp. J27 TaxID=2060419 RepID=UPI0010313797|nr:2'-5' RNA ligase family protein [Flavobacterium sp. J27]
MNVVRRQLTLFLTEQNQIIEEIRATYNPKQFELIKAHVTLCREDEIENNLEEVIQNCHNLHWHKPISIHFNPPERFSEGKGVFISGNETNTDFETLRKNILQKNSLKKHVPHITLIHPRNGTCTDTIFEVIQSKEFPSSINFYTLALIKQTGNEKWKILEEFLITT